MNGYTPEKVAELRAELTRWKEQAEAASARLKATNPEEDWHGLWTIERARAEHLKADRDRLHKAFSRWLSEHDRQVAERASAEGQSRIDAHMQKIAHRVMDVFEEADEETLADEIMSDVFAAIGLTEAFGAAKGEQK